MEFTTENLLNLLEFCTQAVRNGDMNETTQERVWNALNFDKHDPDNAELIKYLFTGWYIHQQLKNNNNN